MKSIYITGAGGFLGREIAVQAVAQGFDVHGLLLPSELDGRLPPDITRHRGDVTKPETLQDFLRDAAGAGIIHCAGLISIDDRPDPKLDAVNVQGTANMLAAAKAAGASKMVYVSSVHAIAEKPHGEVIGETEHFDPAAVHGAYAKSKCAASALVMAAARAGQPVVMVHPSGIIGPEDWGMGLVTTLMLRAIRGNLPAVPPGGYDFVDVRDVAAGALSALLRGETGRSYLLTGHQTTIRHMVALLHKEDSAIRIPAQIPMFLARMAAPFSIWSRRLRHEKPLFTSYSLYTLKSNSAFSFERAREELGYAPRPLEDTIRDVLAWGKRFLELSPGWRG